MGVVAREFFEHVGAFMDYRKTVYEVSDQTIKSNLTDIKLFENFIDNKQHKIIDGPAVMDFQYYLKKDRKNSGKSINRKIFTLRSYSHFIKLQDVPHSEDLPFYDVLKIRQGYQNRPDALTHKQLKLIFNAIDRNTCLGIRDYAIYALMYLAGLRVGEVFELNIDSIDIKNKELHVIGKGGKRRKLHLSDELFQIISEYLAVRKYFFNSDKTKALFVSKKGNRLAIRTMEDNFKKLVLKIGLKLRFNVTCHTLRHTFASHLNDKEIDMLVIQSLMGHATSRSTEPYIHPSHEKIREAMERLPGVIFMNRLIMEEGFKVSFQKKYRKRE
ncbi:MAG TPA: recombinase XerC [Desulfobacteraceae bacterium]|nr:recombinase XerC [Desulfobacteraceae bacterium]